VEPNLRYTEHAISRMQQRGATHAEVLRTIPHGERTLAREGRLAFQKSFPFAACWKGRHYETKQVRVAGPGIFEPLRVLVSGRISDPKEGDLP
jgi:hypothetical protein